MGRGKPGLPDALTPACPRWRCASYGPAPELWRSGCAETLYRARPTGRTRTRRSCRTPSARGCPAQSSSRRACSPEPCPAPGIVFQLWAVGSLGSGQPERLPSADVGPGLGGLRGGSVPRGTSEIGPALSCRLHPGHSSKLSHAVGSNGGGAGGFPVEEAASEQSPRAVHLGAQYPFGRPRGTALALPGHQRRWEPQGEAPSVPVLLLAT